VNDIFTTRNIPTKLPRECPRPPASFDRGLMTPQSVMHRRVMISHVADVHDAPFALRIAKRATRAVSRKGLAQARGRLTEPGLGTKGRSAQMKGNFSGAASTLTHREGRRPLFARPKYVRRVVFPAGRRHGNLQLRRGAATTCAFDDDRPFGIEKKDHRPEALHLSGEWFRERRIVPARRNYCKSASIGSTHRR